MIGTNDDPAKLSQNLLNFKDRGIEEIKRNLNVMGLEEDITQLLLSFMSKDKKKKAYVTKRILTNNLSMDQDLVEIIQEVLFPNQYKSAS